MKKLLFTLTLLITPQIYAMTTTWITYQDKTNGFQIQYPDTASIKKEFSKKNYEHFYLISNAWRYQATENSGKSLLAIALELPATLSPYSPHLEVRIGISDDPKEIANCINKPPYGKLNKLYSLTQKPDTVRINNIPFQVTFYSEAAMSHLLKVSSYRTIYQNRCIAIENIMTYSTGAITDNQQYQAVTQSMAQQQDQASAVINTFRFLKN